MFSFFWIFKTCKKCLTGLLKKIVQIAAFGIVAFTWLLPYTREFFFISSSVEEVFARGNGHALLFFFSLLPSSHTMLKRNWVSGRAKRDRKGKIEKRMFDFFTYVLVEKNVENVQCDLSLTLIIFTFLPWKDTCCASISIWKIIPLNMEKYQVCVCVSMFAVGLFHVNQWISQFGGNSTRKMTLLKVYV